ncbi:hypothetical protein [Actinomadura sp. 6N118]|uniref:hypothetical protein n=1 Tax=Actinomadura sp. 6N118 TaxID=3375151 RepID=UPI0037A2B610
MTVNVTVRALQRASLTRSMERRFGECGRWPLKLRAACIQLNLLHDLIGRGAYAEIISCAKEAVQERSRNTRPVLRLHRDYLSRALCRRFGIDDIDEARQVAWAMLLGLEVALSNEEYGRVMLAAAETLAERK